MIDNLTDVMLKNGLINAWPDSRGGVEEKKKGEKGLKTEGCFVLEFHARIPRK